MSEGALGWVGRCEFTSRMVGFLAGDSHNSRHPRPSGRFGFGRLATINTIFSPWHFWGKCHFYRQWGMGFREFRSRSSIGLKQRGAIILNGVQPLLLTKLEPHGHLQTRPAGLVISEVGAIANYEQAPRWCKPARCTQHNGVPSHIQGRDICEHARPAGVGRPCVVRRGRSLPLCAARRGRHQTAVEKDAPEVTFKKPRVVGSSDGFPNQKGYNRS